MMQTVGLAWVSHFVRPGFGSRFQIRDLHTSYRAPNLFLNRISLSNATLVNFSCDETVDVQSLSYSFTDPLDFFYLTTHGRRRGQDYEALLQYDDWTPYQQSIRARVLILDTCWLADDTDHWADPWLSPSLGPDLRLVLGFRGLSTGDRQSALRGRAFVEQMYAGSSIADAWIQAVKLTSDFRGAYQDRPVAIGIGDSRADAEAVLDYAMLQDIPPSRIGPSIALAVRG
jgi:hypothetical protein